MLDAMLCRSQTNPINTASVVWSGAPLIAAILLAMDAHNMITTIMNTAA